MANAQLSGRCLCGAVRYECDAPTSVPCFCHCQSCRRASGAHAVAWMTVDRRKLRFLQGTPQAIRSSEQVTRTFCGHCGTPLTYRHEQRYGDSIDVTVCTLEDPGRVTPADHIWMEDAVAWDRPADTLPQHRRQRG
ncbi:MAG: GFA family protein [Steroidobacteraceae bacterium]